MNREKPAFGYDLFCLKGNPILTNLFFSLDCQVITTTPGHRVKISFHHFELEIHPQCYYDHLSVYDGDSVSASLVGRFCGNKISNPMIASSNSMYLVFKSDATVQRKGFHGVYSTGLFLCLVFFVLS